VVKSPMQKKFYVSTRCQWWDLLKQFYIARLVSQGYIIIWIYRRKRDTGRRNPSQSYGSYS